MSQVYPCPNCGDVRHHAGPNPGQRRCWRCDEVFTPVIHPAAPAGRPDRGPSPAEGAAPGAAPSTPRAAVLTAAGLLLAGGRLLPLDPRDGATLLERATRMGLRQVWIGALAMRQLGFPDALRLPERPEAAPHRTGHPHPWVDAVTAAGWTCSTDPPGLCGWIGFRRGDGAWLDVVVPTYDDRNPFAGARSGAQLLGALELFARHAGLRYRHSPGSTGLALMQDCHVFKGAAPAPPPALDAKTPDVVTPWVRDAPESGYLVAYDINGMYPAACSSLELGIGEAKAHSGELLGGFQPWPAYWSATVRGPEEPLPLPFRADGRPYWYPSPCLDLARQLDLVMDVSGPVWTWPERRRALRPWYDRVRLARAALLALPPTAEAQLALAALKASANHGIGWLGGRWWAHDDPRYRPDWRAAVIMRARCNLVRHVVKVAERTGQLPALVVRDDTLVYWSDSPDPQVTAARLGLELSTQLGKLKHAGTTPARDFHRQLTDGSRRAPVKAANLVLDQLEKPHAA